MAKEKKKAKQLADVKGWYLDRYERVRVQKNWLLMITFICLVALLIAVMSILSLSDRRNFEPFLIQLDKKTGIATTVEDRSIAQYSARDSVIKSSIARYVLAREGYDAGNYEYFYFGIVRLFSTPKVWRQFYSQVRKGSPTSPLRLGDNSIRKAFIKSITYLNNTKNRVLVRFSVSQYDSYLKNKSKEEHYAATIEYQFVRNLNLKQNERYFNPLNFQVTSYTKDTEDVIDEQ